jgi:ATP synthase protein I
VLAERRPIDPEAKKMWRIAGTTGAVGIEVAVAIVIGTFGGQWVDRRFGTAPWFTIIGFVAGVGAAIKALVRVTREYRKRLQEEDASAAIQQTEKPTAKPSPEQTATKDPTVRNTSLAVDEAHDAQHDREDDSDAKDKPDAH